MGFGEQQAQDEIYALPLNHQNVGRLGTIFDPVYYRNGDHTYYKLLKVKQKRYEMPRRGTRESLRAQKSWICLFLTDHVKIS